MSDTALTIISILGSFIIALIIYIMTVLERRKSTLKQENIQLKLEIAYLKEKVLNHQVKAGKNISTDLINKKYDFIDPPGIYKSKDTGKYYCSSCMTKGVESPLITEEYRWRCSLKECNYCYWNQKYIDLNKKRSRVINPGISIDDI